MGVLKRYVRTRSRPEGSIVEDVATEEIIEFCIEYMDLKPIGVPISRHEGRLLGKGTLGRKAILSPDPESFRQAHYAVLQQVSVVGPYVSKHMAELRKQTRRGKKNGSAQNTYLCLVIGYIYTWWILTKVLTLS